MPRGGFPPDRQPPIPTSSKLAGTSQRRATDFPTSTSDDYYVQDFAVSRSKFANKNYLIKQEQLNDRPKPNQPRAHADPTTDLLAPGEEFTPEALQELENSYSSDSTGDSDDDDGATRPRRKRLSRPTPSTSTALTTTASPAPSASMLWVVMLTVFSAYFIWWRKEKLVIGYCGVGHTAPPGLQHNHYSLYRNNQDPADWTALIRPTCEPCPQNAICKSNFTAACKSDYVLVPNPWSLGGLIPLPPRCEPDSEKLRRIAILSDEAVKVLRKRAADVECGFAEKQKKEAKGGGVEAREVGKGRAIEEADLRRILYELKAPKLSDGQFNELWKAALEDVVGREGSEEIAAGSGTAGGGVVIGGLASGAGLVGGGWCVGGTRGGRKGGRGWVVSWGPFF